MCSVCRLTKLISQSLGCSTHPFQHHFEMPLKCSTKPLHWWWYGVVVNCLIDNSLWTSFMTFDMNYSIIVHVNHLKFLQDHLSLKTSVPERASATVLVSIFFSDVASGYLVVYSARIKMYLFPWPVTGKIGLNWFRCTLLHRSVNMACERPHHYFT